MAHVDYIRATAIGKEDHGNGWILDDLDKADQKYWCEMLAYTNWTSPNAGELSPGDKVLVLRQYCYPIDYYERGWVLLAEMEGLLNGKLEMPQTGAPMYMMTDVMSHTDLAGWREWWQMAVGSTETGKDEVEAAKRLALAFAIITWGTEVVGW